MKRVTIWLREAPISLFHLRRRAGMLFWVTSRMDKIIFNFEYCRKPQHFFCCGFCLSDEVGILFNKIDMKYIKFVILCIAFMGLVLYVTTTGSKERDEQNKVLKNGVTFEGYITDIKKSNNHSFGILTVNISGSTVKEFSKELK